MDASSLRAYIESQRLLLAGERDAMKTAQQNFEKEERLEVSEGGEGNFVLKAHRNPSSSNSDSSLSESFENPSSILRDISSNQCKERAVPRDYLLPNSCSRSEDLPPNSECVSECLENVLISGHNASREEEIRFLQEKLSVASFWDKFGGSASSKSWPPGVEKMVRVGEFSPANPHLQTPGKAHLGLGEYEERRRQLLERKKQEYKDYLSQSRHLLFKTDHIHPSASRLSDNPYLPEINLQQPSSKLFENNKEYLSDAATQTDLWLMQPTVVNSDSSISVVPSNANGFISTDGFTLSVPTTDSPLPSLSPRVPRSHISQTTEQLPDARLRQLQLQEELRQQIEEKKKIEAERRERERMEEEALQRRVAEQQARLQAEYEREEQLRCEREKQKQQQMEDFQRRQEELKVEAELLKQEKRHRKHEAVMPQGPLLEPRSQNAHVVPHAEPTPISILKNASPPPRSPRRAVSPAPSDLSNSPVRLPEQQLQPQPPLSPRALIKVLDGPTYPSSSRNFNDTLPIPLMPVAHTYAPPKFSRRSPRRSVHSVPHIHKPASQLPSDAMQNLEDRWKVPAVQKNMCVREQIDTSQNNPRSVLTQLGNFRRQLQMEHMRMEEKVRESQPHRYHERNFQRPYPH